MTNSVSSWNFGWVGILVSCSAMLCHWNIVISAFSLEEYCDFFTADVRPIVCVLKGLSSTTTARPTNATNATECWCELSCWPKQNWTESDLLSSSEEWFYDCNSCGSRCWINESSKEHSRPRCTCAIVGGSSRKSKCSCSANCATFRSLPFKRYFHGPPPPLPPYLHHFHKHHHPPRPHHGYEYEESEEEDDEVSTNCIFTVNNVYDGLLLDNSSRALNCECTRSKRAEDSSAADFVCICQQV